MTQTVREKNGFGIAALGLALSGLVFGLVPLTGFIAIILGALALVFGLLGVVRARHGMASNKVMTTTASVFGAGALALGIWGVFIMFSVVDEVDREFDRIEQEWEEESKRIEEELSGLDEWGG